MRWINTRETGKMDTSILSTTDMKALCRPLSKQQNRLETEELLYPEALVACKQQTNDDSSIPSVLEIRRSILSDTDQ